MPGSLAKHNWLQEKIKEKPEVAGINVPARDFMVKATEFGIYLDGWALTRPDVYFLTTERYKREEWIVEVKSSHNTRLYDKGMFQLERALYAYAENGLREPDVRLWMPEDDQERYWIQMLRRPKIYRPGDEYGKPSITLENDS